MKMIAKLLLASVLLPAMTSCMDNKIELPPIYFTGYCAWVEQVGDTFLPRTGFATDGEEALAEARFTCGGAPVSSTIRGKVAQLDSEQYASTDITAMNDSYAMQFVGANGTVGVELPFTFDFTTDMKMGEVTVGDFKYDGSKFSATFNKVSGAERYAFYCEYSTDNYVTDIVWPDDPVAAGAEDTQVVEWAFRYSGLTVRVTPCALTHTKQGYKLIRLANCTPITVSSAN